MPITKAASGWVTLDFDADEQMALILSEHREWFPQPADPARYSEGHRLQRISHPSFWVTAALSPVTPASATEITEVPVRYPAAELPALRQRPIQKGSLFSSSLLKSSNTNPRPINRPLVTLPYCHTPMEDHRLLPGFCRLNKLGFLSSSPSSSSTRSWFELVFNFQNTRK